ncbi:MAG: CerR family C-terminal domain-containing protein [Holophagaceae bacterium]
MTTAPSPPDTRSRLLESAIVHFAAQGFEGAGIREIAKDAQANSALVAYHFCGKEGLYREALKTIFSRKPCPLTRLAAVPAADAPGAREIALQCLRDYIRVFVVELMACDPGHPVDEAAMVLMAREMQSPRPASADLLLEQVQPYVVYLMTCLQALRPDLDDETLFLMGGSIQGQLLHFRNSLGITRLIRGNPAFPEDLEVIVQHFTEFSLRGLGVPEAFPQPRP